MVAIGPAVGNQHHGPGPAVSTFSLAQTNEERQLERSAPAVSTFSLAATNQEGQQGGKAMAIFTVEPQPTEHNAHGISSRSMSVMKIKD